MSPLQHPHHADDTTPAPGPAETTAVVPVPVEDTSPAADPVAAGARMPGRSSSGWWRVGPTEMLVHRTDPEGPVRGVVVVLSPPSNERLTTHRTERHLTARLVREGIAVVRTGLSEVSGSVLVDDDDRTLVQRWEDEVAGLVAEAAARYGVASVGLVSTRLGATIAVNAANREGSPVDVVVALAPVGSGRQYLRGIGQLVRHAAEGDGLPLPLTADGLPVQGYGPTFDPASAAHLRAYGLPTDLRAGLAVAVVAGPDKVLDKAGKAFTTLDLVTHLPVEGLASMLDRVSSYALVPDAVLDAVVPVLAAGRSAGVSAPAPQAGTVTLGTDRTGVLAEVVDVAGHPGLLVSPSGAVDRALVWLPGATEPGDGPSGLWVQMARRLAERGIATLLVDLPDSGEATRLDRPVDVYPFEDERADAAAATVRWLGERTGLVPDIGGLCAGAWLALAAAARVPVRTVLAVNMEQWTLDPSIMQRVEADPTTGLPQVVAGPVTEVATTGGAEIARRARLLAKEKLPYAVRLRLGRAGRIQAPQPFLEAVTAHGATVRLLLTRRDQRVFADLHGYRALDELLTAGRDVLVEVDATLDHGTVLQYTRDRVVEFVLTELAGTGGPGAR